MATHTTGSRGGGRGRDFAVTAALSAPRPYVPRTMGMAQRASARVANRWAPESASTVGRSRPLRSLAFADKLMSPYVANAQRAARARYNFSSGRAGYAADAPRTESLAAPEVSWLFPVPWYGDELNWLAAGRAAVEQTVVMATPQRRPARPGQTVRPTLATSQFDQARLEYVAPALAQAAQQRAAQRIAQRVITPEVQSPTTVRPAQPSSAPLRAYSPLVPFAAAQAAELLSTVLADAGTDRSPRATATTAAAPLFHYVAPAQLAAASPAQSTAASRTVVPPMPVITPAVRERLAAGHVMRQVVAQPPRAATTTPPQATPAAATPTPAALTASAPDDVRYASSPSARAIELLTESLLAANEAGKPAAVAPAAGPRVAMPAGMGGLVVGLDAAQTISNPLVREQPRLVAARQLAPNVGPAQIAPTTTTLAVARPALSTLAQSRPAALTHVAWTDRWLARFAGASMPTLTAMSAAEPRTELGARLAAPSPIYLRPPQPEQPASGAFTSPLAHFAAATATRPMPVVSPMLAPRPRTVAPVPRPTVDPSRAPVIADDASTPDEVFAQIASAAMPRTRRTAGVAVADDGRPAPAPAAPVLHTASAADRILRTAPPVPGSGLAAGLISSPVAPLLRGLLALPSVSPAGPASLFDARALSPAAVASAFLAGFTPPVMSLLAPVVTPAATMAEAAPATYLPQPPLARHRAVTALPNVVPAVSAPAGDTATLATNFTAPLVTPAFSPLARRAAVAASLTAPLFDATLIAPPAVAAPAADMFDGATAEAPAPLAYTPTGQLVPAAALAASSLTAASLAPAVSPAMTMIAQPTPGLAATSHQLAQSWSARPGETATIAQSWSAEQETSASDLSLDFVSPELVMAARVYGFTPAQAVQASRLAATGPAGIQAMASAVDMTFLSALAAQQQGVAAHTAQASQLAAAGGTGVPAPAATGTPIGRPVSLGGLARLAPQLAHVARAPRGAFLWPETATQSLGVVPADADRSVPHSLAALDLLAANAVAEAGVFAPAAAPMLADTKAGAAEAGQPGQPGTMAAMAGLPEGFQSIYVALSETPAGRSLSPTVRAARALALAEQASQTTASPSSATMRAAAAWAVLPVVMSPSEAAAGPVTDTRFGDGQPTHMQPNAIQKAASHAGESLRSLVAPQDVAAGRGGRGAVHRAPTAAPELVRTGPTPSSEVSVTPSATQAQTVEQAVSRAARDTSRDLPAWFEQAAKHILAEGRDAEGGMSLAEMTLISFTPQTQIAAATRGQPEPTPPPAGADQGKAAPVMNVEALAEEVYAEVVRLLEIERERNGEPWRS